MKQRKTRQPSLDFSVQVRSRAIGYGVIEDPDRWIDTSRHLYWLEAIDQKDRLLSRGLKVRLVTRWEGGKIARIAEYSPEAQDAFPEITIPESA